MTCRVGNCRADVFCRGYCKKHYQQLNRYGRIKETTLAEPNRIRRRGKVAYIHLRDRHGRTRAMAVIDREDVDLVRGHTWKLDTGKVVAKGMKDGKRFHIKLTHLVLGVDAKFMIRHRNGDHLDCRKENLVITSRSEIAANAKLPGNNTSGHKGVSWNSRFRKWEVYVHRNGKKIPGGYYRDKQDAVTARRLMEVSFQPGRQPTQCILSFPAISSVSRERVGNPVVGT